MDVLDHRVLDAQAERRDHRPDSDAAAGDNRLAVTTVDDDPYPTDPNVFYAMTGQQLLGTPKAGEQGRATATSGTFHALNIGGAVPAQGTQVLCTRVDWRWVFRYDG